MATGMVEVAVVAAGYGCTVVLGWIRARTSVQLSRDRETKRQEIIRALPLGSRVVDVEGAGLLVEVGHRVTALPPSSRGSEDDPKHS